MTATARLQQFAYMLGQLNVYQRLTEHDTSPPTAPPSMTEMILVYRLIARLWTQYREDRPNLSLNERLLSVESEVGRTAFLGSLKFLTDNSNTNAWRPLTIATRLLERMADPLPASFRTAAAEQLDSDNALLDTLLPQLSAARPQQPIDLLYQLCANAADVDVMSPHEAADNQCWAYNLALAINPNLTGLTFESIPFPGILRRRCFRTDLTPSERRSAIMDHLTRSATQSISTHHNAIKLTATFNQTFPSLRSTSRLGEAWILISGLRSVTVKQVSRALKLSELGSRRMLQSFTDAKIAVHQSPHFNLARTFRARDADPAWLRLSDAFGT